MNRLIENNYVTEMKFGTNFAYVLNDNNSFLPTEYKVLQGQSDSCFLRCMKMYLNGNIQLFYITESNVSFLSLLSTVNADSFLTIVSNLFGNILEAKINGFLSCRNIDISLDHIFVDPSTLKVKLVYVPIRNTIYNDDSTFENEIRTILIKLISESVNLSAPSVMYLSSNLQNGSISLENIYRTLNGKSVRPVEDLSINKKENVQPKGLKLVTMNSQNRMELLVNKPEFVIGKKASAVDGVVSFNKMISRVHCKITHVNSQYFIEDLQSANGTYVNNKKLQPNQKQAIINGDIVRLANSDFQVVMS